MEILLGGKAVEKIWKTIHKCVGGFLAPWQYRRMADAKRGARRLDALSIAQTKKDIQQIHSGQKRLDENSHFVDVPADEQISLLPAHTGDALSADTLHDVNYKASGGLIESIEANEKTRLLQKAVNLAETVSRAEEIAADTKDEDVSEEEVDPDWFTRWRDGAENISAEKIQEIWAKVLAGEVSNPGKYSLRTLDFLKTMSKTEAQLIERVGQFIVSDDINRHHFIALVDFDFFKNHGLQYEDFLELRSMGFLGEAGADQSAITYGSDAKDEYKSFLNVCETRLYFHSHDSYTTLELSAYSLTKVGKELINLGNFTANKDYVKKIAWAAFYKGIKTYYVSSEGIKLVLP